MPRKPDIQRDPDELRRHYEERRSLLEALAVNLNGSVVEQLKVVRRVDRVSFRVKATPRFVSKVMKHDPPYRMLLVEVEDQVAGRVLVLFLSDVEVIRQRVHEVFRPVEGEYRRPRQHNVFDYESWQGVFNIPPQARPPGWETRTDLPTTFELQIRTLFQHAYAEPQHDVGYKPEGRVSDDDLRELAWVAASAWGADHALERVRARLVESGHDPSNDNDQGTVQE